MIGRLIHRLYSVDLSSPSSCAVAEERYRSLRRQVPIIYLLGLVNLSALELAASGKLTLGLNLPTFIAGCGLLRITQWFRTSTQVSHELMARRMKQTVWFAAIVCLAVCARCLQLLDAGDVASRMAVMLFGGLTAIGVAYGLTALPAAGYIPLVLIIIPISAAALASGEPRFQGAAFGLVVVAGLTMRLLAVHSRHFTAVINSRSVIAREQKLVERAHQEAVVAATTDFLTGLPNRRAFVSAVEAHVAEGEKGEPFALAILDLDRFKAVNDTFGHATGDRLLQEAANRLVRTIGPRGLVARLGGDEFGILLPGIDRIQDADAIGNEILAGVNGPVFVKSRQTAISACCGICVSHGEADRTPSRVMADADLALYQAKERQCGGAAVFASHMEAPRRRRVEIERALQQPGIKHDFRVVFQPIVDLVDGKILALEALARWDDYDLGPVSPSEFVPIAEQLNLIVDLNNHLMKLAFAEARNWPAHVKLSFNLSALQICAKDAAGGILRALSAAGLAPERLQVEVTETALLADFESARESLTQLKSAGATIVLDDFGAGYASIGYLRELRFDQIKLDGGLVTAAQHSTDGKRLLRAVIALCEILGVASVAEHVESAELLALVSELGCTAGQGFWLQRPVPASEISEFTLAAGIVMKGVTRRHAA
jgi:diguanylate cyclase (GGDEF)-like protein